MILRDRPVFDSHGHPFGVGGVGERYIGALVSAQLSSSLSAKLKNPITTASQTNMSQNYHIQSQDTKYCLISHYEVEGEKNGLGSFPEHSVRIQRSHFLRIIPGTLIPFRLDFNRISSCQGADHSCYSQKSQGFICCAPQGQSPFHILDIPPSFTPLYFVKISRRIMLWALNLFGPRRRTFGISL